ncbi:Protein of unknown function DUF3110 [Dillenia turbinata]|uniref:Uncharacterized protein n=1 Tax=Dillenia turbinata TaxID=194707 RepID=A0AAN8VGK2_9MAGN
MDSLPSVSSPSIALSPATSHLHHRHHRRRWISVLSSSSRSNLLPRRLSSSFVRSRPFFSPEPSRARLLQRVSCRSGGDDEEGEGDEGSDEIERALRLDGTIPGTSNEFVKQVSSRAYGIRRNLEQTFDSSSYDVLETNPWRETSKPVYVLTHMQNHEVERELGLLFSKGGKFRSGIGNKATQSRTGTKFQMRVEDIREGVLVFEDETEAARYCGLLKGGGQGCEGVAEIEASSVFDLCQKMRALAVLIRRGRTPPVPENLQLNLRARKRSLEDQEDMI